MNIENMLARQSVLQPFAENNSFQQQNILLTDFAIRAE